MSTSRNRPGGVLQRDSGRPAAARMQRRADGGDMIMLITDLPYEPRVAEVAREAVTVALHGAVETDLLNDARLIGSELATNAFTSGSPPLVLCVDRRSLAVGGLEVEISVTDGGCPLAGPPSPPAPEEEAESGRGLVIVEALADTWSLTTGTHGTRAWCRLTRGALSSPTDSN